VRNLRDLFERLEQTVVVEEEEKGCGRAARREQQGGLV
jgi:hypothetical protein